MRRDPKAPSKFHIPLPKKKPEFQDPWKAKARLKKGVPRIRKDLPPVVVEEGAERILKPVRETRHQCKNVQEIIRLPLKEGDIWEHRTKKGVDVVILGHPELFPDRVCLARVGTGRRSQCWLDVFYLNYRKKGCPDPRPDKIRKRLMEGVIEDPIDWGDGLD